MANPGGVGSKYVSANLNKSYGQPPHHNHAPYGGSYGQAASSRTRPGGGGGGMVVLSRNRPLQKAVPKLSIPPPLNLPSLRKEHERFDPSGSTGGGYGGGGGGGTGGGTRPTSSGMGWTKPVAAIAVEENDGSESRVVNGVDRNMNAFDGISRGSGSYMPPSAKSVTAAPSLAARATVLRGEDFPSLRAALPTTSGPVQKQKDNTHKKQKQTVGAESSNLQGEIYQSSLAQIHPRGQSAQRFVGNNGSKESVVGEGFERVGDQTRKQEELFPGPLPMVQLNPRSDWADDERDTGHGFSDRGRSHELPKNESYWDRDFDIPRSSLPQKPVQNQFNNRWGQHDNNTTSAKEVSGVDPYHRNARTPSNGVGEKASSVDRDLVKENHYTQSHFTNHVIPEARQQLNHTRDRYSTKQSSRYSSDSFHSNNSASKSSFFPSKSEGIPAKDPKPKFSFSKNEKPYSEDPFLGDERDPFSGGLLGVIKRKKDVVKQPDFHDPVRESFEAELERVQQMQEMERRRIVEEHERALEQARREEEERQRLIIEEEQRQRRMEEEAREAAWRVEQERVEAIQRAEELKIAREEEKKKIFMEEERRKQAAKQKLLELEAMMAKRQAESKNHVLDVANKKEKDDFKAVDRDEWDDSERMVERIVTSESSGSSFPNRSFEMGSSMSQSFLDRGKHVNMWRKHVFENDNTSSILVQEHENGLYSPDRGAYAGGGRAFPRKELYGGAGQMPSRSYYAEERAHLNEHMWSSSGGRDHYGKSREIEIEPEFHDNLDKRYGDVEWGPSRSHSHHQPPYPGRIYQHNEGDEIYPYGRSRYSMRQPRVLPPPSLSSMHRTSFRGENEQNKSTFMDDGLIYNHATGNESNMQIEYSDSHQEKLEPSPLLDVHEESAVGNDLKQVNNVTPRCDSQSSLSVSSPPNSPPHLSHDELDESGDSGVLSDIEEGKRIHLSETENNVLNDKSGRGSLMLGSSSISAGEDEEWPLENNEDLQGQEEYDEEENGYQEEEEAHEGDDDKIDITQEFEGLHLEDRDSPHMMDNLVLGFNEGVEVGIPSDDFERNQKNEATSNFGVPEVSVVIGDAEGVPGDGEGLQVDSSPQASTDLSSGNVQKKETTVQESVILPVQTSAPSQADLPKLQFGLFSGPTLIPSPVLSIQIGSIQMPLHLHPPVGPSLTHIHPSQPPLFHFGQLRYTSPTSQGLLPVSSHYNLAQNSVPVQPTQETSAQPVVSSSHELPQENILRGLNPLPVREIMELNVPIHEGGMDISVTGEDKKHQNTDTKVYMPLSKKRGPENQSQNAPASGEKYFSGSNSQGPFPSRGRRFGYSVRNSGMRSEASSYSDSGGFQRMPRRVIHRTEFRIRENGDRRQSLVDDKSNSDGRGFGRSGSKRSTMSNKPLKLVVEPESSRLDPVSVQETISESRAGKGNGKEAITKSSSTHTIDLKKNDSEEDVDAPLQSGIVRVFKQSGIEAPSDEDDFIEVRSKRQMLNDKREQREKELKAKSRIAKPPRKPRTRQTALVSTSLNKNQASLGGEASDIARSEFVVQEGQSVASKEVSTGSMTAVSQPLAPIGTPTVNPSLQDDIRSNTIKSYQTDPVSVGSSGENDLESGALFESKNKVADDVQTASVSWDSAQINQQVMALTQTQLDEAMKSAQFDAHGATIGGHTNSGSSKPILPSSSILMKDASFSSTASPINSLLAGEKIQFGAVTSPTVLPPSSRVVTHGVGAPGSSRSDIQISRKISSGKNDHALFFEEDKHPNEPCVHLEDCEAGAEAAASAVAVAGITCDEIVENGLGPVTVSDVKSSGGTGIDEITRVVASDQQLGSQFRAEESLTVSLPADLSIETPSISLWPPLPSPPNSSTQMPSYFPGGPPPHFPYYEMNPMLGGPIYAFGPHEESSTAQSQAQKSSTAPGSGPLAPWQPCHPVVDSFYGPPAGFTGPFVGPPGGIPGVQGPPHMVVYNHFAPVGQFGQVGLSFMGTTYIQSGKQPDWKHNPGSGMGMGDGNMDNMNMVSAQRNPANMAAPVQHLAPGSPLLPMAMFDASPFQPASDISAQAWSRVPASPIHTLPLSQPLQQQQPALHPAQFSRGHPPVDQSLSSTTRFSDPQTSTPQQPPPPPQNNRTFPIVTDPIITQFPEELGLVADPATTATTTTNTTNATISQGAAGGSDNCGSHHSKDQNADIFKNRTSQGKIIPPIRQQYGQSMGYNSNYQRGGGGGGVSQKNNMGGNNHRRVGFQGRNQQSMGVEKGFPPSKMKQVYVPKQTTGS